MIDIFRSDFPSNTIVSLARFRVTTWNYLNYDPMRRIDLTRSFYQAGGVGKIVNCI